jgi:hypothetical protein
MSLRKKSFIVVLLGIMLISLIASCRKSPATVTPTSTPRPRTSATSTKTTTAVNGDATPTSTAVEFGGLVESTPVPEWKKIPLMPGAIAGNETSKNYAYTINATQSAVVAFYARELPKLGWEPKPRNGTPDPGGIVSLVFSKGQQVCIIGIIPQKVGVLVVLGINTK